MRTLYAKFNSGKWGQNIKSGDDSGPCAVIYVVGGTKFKNEANEVYILDIKDIEWTSSQLNKNELVAADSHIWVIYSINYT